MIGAALLAALAGLADQPQAQEAKAKEYFVYVTAESSDEVYQVRFDGEKAETTQRIPVGRWPTEIEGPHGLAIDPSGDYWYLSMAHGLPFGNL